MKKAEVEKILKELGYNLPERVLKFQRKIEELMSQKANAESEWRRISSEVTECENTQLKKGTSTRFYAIWRASHDFR